MPLKSEVEKSLSDLAATIDPLLEALRRDGKCCLCHSPNGIQHTTTCPIWDMIIARSNVSMMNDSC
jgi:hypothetical protein